MERRRHPTYDRASLRFLLVMALLLLACAGIAWLCSSWEVGWLSPVALVPFLALVGFALVKGRGINACPCPGCSNALRRAPCTTEFVCASCQVTWWTRSYGESIWD